MKNKPFVQKELGGRTTCAVCMVQGTCQSSIDSFVEVVKGDSWFGSVKSVVEIRESGV
jgi:phenylpyruvate tautomerase PptA (4-oxalocrotonate tautomerase family)